MIRRKPSYVPVAIVVAPRFVVLPSLRSRRLIEAFGVATEVPPLVVDSSVASASVGSEVLASTRTTKTSTRATSEKGKGASVMRTVKSPVPVPIESLLHAATPRVASAMSAKSRSVLFISYLLHECVGCLRVRFGLACRARSYFVRLGHYAPASQLSCIWRAIQRPRKKKG